MKKHGNRIVLMCSAALLCIGFLGASFLNPAHTAVSLYQLYFFYGIFCGSGVGIGNICILDEVGRISPSHAGVLTGIVQMSFGLGGLVFGMAAKKLMVVWGVAWTFRVLAVIAAAVMLLGAYFAGKRQLAAAGVRGEGDGEAGVSPEKMLRTAQFWLFLVWNISIAAAGLMIINSAVQIAGALMLPVMVGLMVSICNSVGRLCFGNVYDRFSQVPSMYLPPVLMGIAGFLLFFAAKTNAGLVGMIGLLAAGIAYGSSPITTAAFIRKTFGTRHFSHNMSLAQFSLIPASLLGPYFSGLLQGYDKAHMTVDAPQAQMFGSTFIAVICFAAITILVNTALLKCTVGQKNKRA